MHTHRMLPLALAAVLLLAGPAHARPRTKVRMTDVQVLTLQAGLHAKSKNARSGVPQLTCTGGCQGDVRQVQCKNEGLDDSGELNWRCSASLPKGCKFARTEVSCEGHADMDDEFITPGSCALEYALECGRLDAAQAEETKLRAKVKLQREAKQTKMLEEVARIQSKAEADKCEMAVAGALYPVAFDVEVQLSARHGTPWEKGTIEAVACDGSYSVFVENGLERGDPRNPPPAAPKTGIREEALRPFVNTIYKEVIHSRPVTKYRRVKYIEDVDHSTHTQPSQATEELTTEQIMIAVALVLLVVLAYAMGWIKPATPEEVEAMRQAAHARAAAACPVKEGMTVFAYKAGQGYRRYEAHVKACLLDRANWAFDLQYQDGDRANVAFGMIRQVVLGGERKPVTSLEQTVTKVPDEVAMEAKRQQIKTMLALQRDIRVAQVEAKQNIERLAALDKYAAEVQELQQSIESDISHLGNVMARFDHVQDQYEAVGFGVTNNR